MNSEVLILSDLHLGSSYSNPKPLLKFLKEVKTDLLILNGDIIDGWALKRSMKMSVDEVNILKQIRKMSNHTRVIYLRGNHDDFLDDFIPMDFGKIEIEKEFQITLYGKRYLITHGDLFDKITKKVKWISKLGDVGYSWIIKLNKMLNHFRSKLGMPYYSLSSKIKQSVKRAVNYISDFEDVLVNYAKHRKFHGIICGHIHHPEIKLINNIEYLNSGDWVESMSYLVFNEKSDWELKFYKK